MMKSDLLIQNFIQKSKAHIDFAGRLKNKNAEYLTWRSSAASWNILECLQHLNLYGDYYLPVIEDKMCQSKHSKSQSFKSGLPGGYFAKVMLPREKPNKMNTFKDKNPLNADLDETVIDIFAQQQVKLIELLEQAKNNNLNKIKIPVSISPWIKLKLGDTFLFYVNHITRHVQQVEKVEAMLKSAGIPKTNS